MNGIRKCLLIDDDEDDQEIFKMCLHEVGKDIQFLSAYNGQEAVEMLMSNSDFIPYIFLDVNMPKMNGFECLGIIRNIAHLKNTKIFMYSTTSETHVLEESKRLGADEYIIKPSSTTELIQKLFTIFKMVSE